MKKITKFLLISIVMINYGKVSAQTARIQAIHNSADLAAATVDVYVNGTIFLNDFAFRTATPFVTVPAGVPLSIDVAPGNSTSTAQSIYNLTTTLASNATYILVANGIVSASGYSPNQPFQISVFPQGRETALSGTNTDIVVNHGATDAPTVDVIETNVPAGTIVNDISYPSFTSSYLEVPTANYALNVTDASGANVVASYAAPLQTLGLQGQALTVLASGFLNPSQNSNGPAFGLWAALASGGNLVQLPLITTAKAQVIHNCADLAAATVDVYINNVLTLDNFAFRTATPFVSLPAGVPVSIDVAPASSTSSAQSIYNLTTTLAPNQRYILVANGTVSASGYNPARPFQLSVFSGARENASVTTKTDVLVNHGATDAPTVDVVETNVPAGTIVNDISYPSFSSGYLELPTANYALNVTDASGATVVASYAAPLQTLGLQGQALTVLASGFLNPSQNSNGPAFGLWAALASGGNLVQLPLITTAKAQVIHNCADLAAATVDVYINNVLTLDNFAFRTATPFVDLPAGVPVSIDVAPASSTSSAQSIYNLTTTLAPNERYILVANGLVSATGYNPPQVFQLSVFSGARENAATATNTDILINHGSTDAPQVDVVETSVPAGTIVNNISYPSFISSYLELPTANYALNVTDSSGTVVVASYAAPLQTLGLQGKAITVLASGFLNPSQNSNGPAFGLWAALPAGGNLVPLPTSPLGVSQFDKGQIQVYPNPVSKFLKINLPENYGKASAILMDYNGRKLMQIDNMISDQISFENVAEGIYVLNLTIDNVNYSKKIIVER
jgi:Domain of unknown function (DUF4397)/Secretion system C-terminal sorting domain